MEQKSLIALLVLIAIVSTLSPNFFTINNLFNILQQTSVNAIMAVGMTLVILTSGIDLSVGSLLALTGAVAASIVGGNRGDCSERSRSGVYRYAGYDAFTARRDHGLYQW